MKAIDELVPLKPGKDSKEFLGALIIHFAALIAAITGGVDGATASVVTTVSSGLYAIGRSWVKGPYPLLVSGKASWRTSEFWLLAFTVLANGVLAVSGDISADWAVTAGSIATFILTITRSMAKRPATIPLTDVEMVELTEAAFDS